MFFFMVFEKDVTVTPADLSKDLTKIVKVKLYEQLTGTCHPKYGYFIRILEAKPYQNGLIMDGTGDIVFKMIYKVVVMRPFKGEICDGIVEKVFNEGGIHVRVGPMIVFIPEDEMPPAFTLDKKNLIYIHEKESTELKIGSKVRFRYKAIQYQKNEFLPIGTMRDNYLGSIQDNKF